MEEKFIKNFIEEQKHKEFIREEKFGEELFDKIDSLLKIYIVPFSISQEKIDFLSEKIKSWVAQNHYFNNNWHFFINGIRVMDVIEENNRDNLSCVLSLFKNATISYCKKLSYSNSKEKFIAPQKIKSDIGDFMPIAGKFYGKLELNLPVKIYLELIRVNGSVLDLSGLNIPEKYSLELNGKWKKENLFLSEKASTEEIFKDYPKVEKKIRNRFAQAFGLWEL